MDTSEKPKTVATIDVNLVIPKIPAREWLQECIEEHLNCVLCGTGMVFEHKTDFIAQTVVENAHCPACRIRNRQSAHRLQ
jgi:hypothetical protein